MKGTYSEIQRRIVRGKSTDLSEEHITSIDMLLRNESGQSSTKDQVCDNEAADWAYIKGSGREVHWWIDD